jgi:uncharacterized protein YdiU (UPF0061 family)
MSTYNDFMSKKLGLTSPDTALVNQLLTLMARSGADWTNTFRALAHTPGTAAATTTNGSSSGSGSDSTPSTSSSSSGVSASAAEQQGGDAEQEQYSSSEAAEEAYRAAGLPQRLVDAFTADALAEEGPALVDEWSTWLRLWRGRLAEEGLPEEVGQVLRVLYDAVTYNTCSVVVFGPCLQSVFEL